MKSRAVAQAVNRRLLTSMARVQAQVMSCWISALGRFPPSTLISPANHSIDCSTLIIIQTGTIGQ
jgi:hypothetical protein